MKEHSSKATTPQMLNAGMHLVVQTYGLAMVEVGVEVGGNCSSSMHRKGASRGD